MPQPIVRRRGLVDYASCLADMQQQNRERVAESPDEIWLLQHPPVFTQGLAGKAAHLLAPGEIPVVQVERGGQVTYHGPGQWVVYLMLDLRRLGYGVKELVFRIEQALIDTLQDCQVSAVRQAGMPGVYTAVGADSTDGLAKIAAVGLRVARHATYHGLALNVDMDLEPFGRINPCGYAGLAVTQLRDVMPDFDASVTMEAVGERLLAHLNTQLFGHSHG